MAERIGILRCVSGLSALLFVAGIDSHGRPLPAQRNQAQLLQAGVDVTNQLVVNPNP